MADNKVNIKVTTDKQQLEILRQEFKKSLEDIKGFWKNLNEEIKASAKTQAETIKANAKTQTETIKANAKIQAETIKANTKEIIASKKTETAQIIAETKRQIESEKLEYKKSLDAFKQAEKEKKEAQKQVEKQSKIDSKFTGQTTVLDSVNAIKQQIKYFTELRNSVSSSSPAFQEYTNKIINLKSSLSELGGTTKMSKFQLLEMGENITIVVRGIYDLISGIKSLGTEFINKGAELNVLRSGFKGTEEDLQSLRNAVAGTVTDAGLMKLSNQASLLNIDLKDQARILGFVEERFDLFGGNVEEGFEKFLNAVQGGAKGLRSLRLDTNEYTQVLNELVKTQGGELEIEETLNNEKEIKIKNLPAETQMQLRLQAALKLLNYTYGDSQNKTRDLKDKTEALRVATENAKASIGEGLAKALFGLTDSLGLTSESANKTVGTIAALSGQMIGLIPIISQLKIAFPNLGTTIAGVFGSGGIVVGAIGITLLWVKMLGDRISDEIQRVKELEAYNKRVKEGTEMGIINPNAPSEQTLKGARKLLEKDPEAEIKVEGKTMKVKDYVKALEEANEKSKQSTYWNEQFNNHLNQTIDKTNNLTTSLKEATEKVSNYRKALDEYKGDISKIPELQKKYNEALKEEENIRKQLYGDKTSGKSGKSGNTKTERETTFQDIISQIQTEIKNLELKKLLNKESLDLKLQELENSKSLMKDLKDENDYLEYKNELENKRVQLVLARTQLTKTEVEDIYPRMLELFDKKPLKEDVLSSVFNLSSINAYQQAIETLGQTFGNFFEGLAMGGDNAKNSIKETMKSIVKTFLTSVQIMLIGANADMFAKAIATFGISLIKDTPLLALGFATLEIAKSMIGALYTGTEHWRGGLALVGDDKGKITPYTELIDLPAGSKVYNNRQTMKILNTNMNENINKIYIASNMPNVEWFEVTEREYKSYLKAKKV